MTTMADILNLCGAASPETQAKIRAAVEAYARPDAAVDVEGPSAHDCERLMDAAWEEACQCQGDLSGEHWRAIYSGVEKIRQACARRALAHARPSQAAGVTFEEVERVYDKAHGTAAMYPREAGLRAVMSLYANSPASPDGSQRPPSHELVEAPSCCACGKALGHARVEITSTGDKFCGQCWKDSRKPTPRPPEAVTEERFAAMERTVSKLDEAWIKDHSDLRIAEVRINDLLLKHQKAMDAMEGAATNAVKSCFDVLDARLSILEQRLSLRGAVEKLTGTDTSEAAFDDQEGKGPCGGRRCFLSRARDGVWIHSSKSYGTCTVRPWDLASPSGKDGE